MQKCSPCVPEGGRPLTAERAELPGVCPSLTGPAGKASKGLRKQQQQPTDQLSRTFLKKLLTYIYRSVLLWWQGEGMCLPQHTWEGQRTVLRSCFSPSTCGHQAWWQASCFSLSHLLVPLLYDLEGLLRIELEALSILGHTKASSVRSLRL